MAMTTTEEAPAATARAVPASAGQGSTPTVERAGNALVTVVFVGEALAMVGVVALVLGNVIGTDVFHHSLFIAEHLEIVLFIWLTFLAIAQAMWEDSAPRLGLLKVKTSGARASIVTGARTGLALGYFVIVLISGFSAWPSFLSEMDSVLGVTEAVYLMPVIIGAGLSLILLAMRLFLVRQSGTLSLTWCSVSAALSGGVLLFLIYVVNLNGVAVAVGAIVALLALGVPVAVGLGVAGYFLVISTGGIAQVAFQLVAGPNNITLVALPLFLFMGALLAQTSLANRLSTFLLKVFGRLPGGVGLGCIAASAVFANMTGSAIGDSAALGTIFIPQMVRSGDYEADGAAALQAAAGVVGVIFPPAVAMILFATVANLSVIDVFKATIIPGLLVVLAMGTMNVLVSRRRRARLSAEGGSDQTAAWTTRQRVTLIAAIGGAIPVLIVPFVLDGGIFSGLFTAAQSGAVAIAVVCIFVIVLRESKSGEWVETMRRAVRYTSVPMFILVNASILSWGLASSNVAQDISNALSTVGHNKLLLLLIINLVFILIHTVVDTAPSILVLVPLVIPATLAAGVNPYQLAAIIAVNSTLGLMLPPVGTSLFVSSSIAKVSVESAARRVLPFVLSSLIVLAIVTIFPAVSLSL